MEPTQQILLQAESTPERVGVEGPLEAIQPELLLTEPVPDMPVGQSELSADGDVQGFFARRSMQLASVWKKARVGFDKKFGQEITTPDTVFNEPQMTDMRLTGVQAIRARLHPYQLKRNVQGNINQQKILGTQRDRTLAHPVVRNVLYKRAYEGDEAARSYLGQYDRRLGMTALWGVVTDISGSSAKLSRQQRMYQQVANTVNPPRPPRDPFAPVDLR